MKRGAMAVSTTALILQDDLPMQGLPARGKSLPASHVYTSEHFERHHPDAAAKVLAWWPKFSLRTIAKSLGHSINTVRAFLLAKGKLEVDTLKSQLRQTATFAALQMAERIADDPDAVPNSAVALTGKLMIDTAQLAGDAPTAIVEHRHELRVTPEVHQAALEELQRRAVLGTGLAAENAGTKRPIPITLEADAEVVSGRGSGGSPQVSPT
jgi:hypothetical protein